MGRSLCEVRPAPPKKGGTASFLQLPGPKIIRAHCHQRPMEAPSTCCGCETGWTAAQKSGANDASRTCNDFASHFGISEEDAWSLRRPLFLSLKHRSVDSMLRQQRDSPFSQRQQPRGFKDPRVNNPSAGVLGGMPVLSLSPFVYSLGVSKGAFCWRKTGTLAATGGLNDPRSTILPQAQEKACRCWP